MKIHSVFSKTLQASVCTFLAVCLLGISQFRANAAGTPVIVVEPDHGWIAGHDWLPATDVTVIVDDDPDPADPLYSATQTPGTEMSVLFNVEQDNPSLDLVPGMYIWMSNGLTSKDTQIEELHFDYLFTDTELTGGRGPASATGSVYVQTDTGDYSLDINVNVGGTWTGNFYGLFDLVNVQDANVQVFDGDDDSTMAHRPDWTLHVVPSDNEVHGHNWPLGVPVTLIIDNDANPGNGTLFEQTKNPEDDQSCGSPCFNLQGIFTIGVGQYVTMTDGNVSKRVLVSPLSVNNYNGGSALIILNTDIIPGNASPGAIVTVNINSQGGLMRQITADGSGNWTANYSVKGDQDFEQNTADIKPLDHGRAIILNMDGTDDGTLQYWDVPIYTATFLSTGSYDGWIMESSEKGNKGGTKDNRGKTFMVGDDAYNRQYRGILSFDTASIPDGAEPVSCTLKVKKAGLVGTDPFRTHKGMYLDIIKGYFGTSPKLQLYDFQARFTVHRNFPTTLNSGWYKIVVGPCSSYINRTGTTQIRLRFYKDDNNDFGADYLKFYSGNAPVASRPQLIIEYYVP